ncbi:MAG: exonuclease domain-containing protein, partial [Betaproteobacteria bacterium]
MAQDANSLIWIDMEMSGLNPEVDRVLEIAVVITDSNLNAVVEAPVLVVHQPDAVLGTMDEWNTSMHGKS